MKNVQSEVRVDQTESCLESAGPENKAVDFFILFQKNKNFEPWAFFSCV